MALKPAAFSFAFSTGTSTVLIAVHRPIARADSGYTPEVCSGWTPSPRGRTAAPPVTLCTACFAAPTRSAAGSPGAQLGCPIPLG